VSSPHRIDMHQHVVAALWAKRAARAWRRSLRHRRSSMVPYVVRPASATKRSDLSCPAGCGAASEQVTVLHDRFIVSSSTTQEIHMSKNTAGKVGCLDRMQLRMRTSAATSPR